MTARVLALPARSKGGIGNMRLVQTVAIVAAAMLAMSLLGSASAFAVEGNPKWATCLEKAGGEFENSACTKSGGAKSFELAFLGEKETSEIQAESKPKAGKQKLKLGTGNPIACAKLKLKKGANAKGSGGTQAGTLEETIEYSECEVEKSPNCKINGEAGPKAKITTNAIKATLAFETKEAAEKAEAEKDVQTVLVLEPVEKTFAVFELSGEGCPVTGTVHVEGSTVARIAKKPAEEHAVNQELITPEVPITKYVVNKEGKAVETTGVELKVAGVKAALVGETLAMLIVLRGWWPLFSRTR